MPERSSPLSRLAGAWRAMAREQRLALLAALALLVTMFLPWYSLTVRRTGDTTVLSAFGDFSFVEVAVLLVAVAVAVLLFARAEGRAFHLPGGDGTIVMLAGAWVGLLLFYRLVDKPGESAAEVTGVRWGIFLALLAAGMLAYAGYRIRAAHRPEPPLPGEAPAQGRPPARPAEGRPATRPAGRRPPSPPAPGDERTVAMPGRRTMPTAPQPDDPPEPPAALS